MRLYFIRHGENQANIDHIMAYKVVNFPLTPKGVEQAEYLAAWLSDHKIARVYSSTLQRAWQTAEIIRGRLALPEVRQIEDLREVNVGVLDGKSDLASWEIHDGILLRWNEGEATALFEEGEDHHALRERLRRAVEEIVTENADLGPEQGIAVVAHGGLLVYGLPWLCHDLPFEQVQGGLKNTALSVVEVKIEADSHQFSCVRWGSLEHLPPS